MYRFFNLFLDSDIPLDELQEGKPAGPSDSVIRVRLENGSAGVEQEIDWLQTTCSAQGHPLVAFGRVGPSFIIRYPHGTDFLASPSSSIVGCYPAPGVTSDTLRHLLLDQVVPRLVGQSGQLVLHASAIRHADRAIAFLGDSGSGKSTLAASFATSAEAELISDDCMLVESCGSRANIFPSYPGSRLWPDALEVLHSQAVTQRQVAQYTVKKRLILRPGRDTSDAAGIPLRALFVLGERETRHRSDAPVIQRIPGQQALMALIRGSFLIDSSESRALRKQFQAAARVLQSDTRLFFLHHPKSFTRLPEVRSEILQAAS